jgi:hypothetical protein
MLCGRVRKGTLVMRVRIQRTILWDAGVALALALALALLFGSGTNPMRFGV